LTDHRLIRAARTLIEGHFDVQSGEGVLISADTRTEPALIEAIADAVIHARGRPMAAIIPQLPFQGALADPYIPDTLAAAAARSDVWIDCCFPYLAGSTMHDAAMSAGRARYALLATAGASSFARLYGGVEFSSLMDYQMALVEYLDAKAGSVARLTCPSGTDLSFTLDAIKLKRERVARSPGMHTVPGAQSLYPVIPSVTGRVVLQAVFDEHYHLLRRPIRIEANGEIQGLDGAAAEDKPRLERALRRASGSDRYGSLIHFTVGFHPAARVTGKHFIEDIRALGTNAVGMGRPWWEEGGGENHPDGVVMDQSVWIDGELIVESGQWVGPSSLMPVYARVRPCFE
jgi:leucyl aminopeptidase (aminopeptidase T)